MKFTIRLILASLLLSLAVLVSAEDATAGMAPLTERLYRTGFGVPPEPIDAPNFSVPDLSGNNISLSSLKGKVVLLNFWATWCPPCREEMPAMEELYQKLKGEKFTILAVSTRDQRETQAKVVEYIQKNGYTFPVLFDDTAAAVPGFYHTGSIPTSYIIDKEGKIVARLIGSYKWNNTEIIDLLRDLSTE